MGYEYLRWHGHLVQELYFGLLVLAAWYLALAIGVMMHLRFISLIVAFFSFISMLRCWPFFLAIGLNATFRGGNGGGPKKPAISVDAR